MPPDPVGVVGLGLVGGTVSKALAEAGIGVRGYDRYLKIGRPEDLSECRVVFVCVSTPSAPRRGYDLSEVWASVREIEPRLGTDSIVALKSTVSPGTSDRLAAAFPRIEFASVPEFLVAARPLETFTHPDRVIIGARSGEAAAVLSELFHAVAPEAPVIILRPIEAELAKLSSNALLAAKVAMANQLSEVCDRYDASWPRVKAAVGLDRRIGPDHLSVTEEGGFGGACLPKDLEGLIAAAESAGETPSLLKAIAGFNERIRGRADDINTPEGSEGSARNEDLASGDERREAV